MNMTMMMPMYFGFPVDNTYLFEKFSSSNATEYILWLVGILVFSFAIQYLSHFRTQIQNKTLNELLRI